jgi:hypothetical protein
MTTHNQAGSGVKLPPIGMILGAIPTRVERSQGVKLTTHPHLVP